MPDEPATTEPTDKATSSAPVAVPELPAEEADEESAAAPGFSDCPICHLDYAGDTCLRCGYFVTE